MEVGAGVEGPPNWVWAERRARMRVSSWALMERASTEREVEGKEGSRTWEVKRFRRRVWSCGRRLVS